MNDAWFVLFEGSSPDGRGDAKFLCRTMDSIVANKYAKRCAEDPYSTGYVLKITDTACERLRAPDSATSLQTHTDPPG